MKTALLHLAEGDLSVVCANVALLLFSSKNSKSKFSIGDITTRNSVESQLSTQRSIYKERKELSLTSKGSRKRVLLASSIFLFGVFVEKVFFSGSRVYLKHLKINAPQNALDWHVYMRRTSVLRSDLGQSLHSHIICLSCPDQLQVSVAAGDQSWLMFKGLDVVIWQALDYNNYT